MTQYILNIVVLSSIYVLFALGMALTWGTIGILNFAHGAVFMFSSFLTSRINERIDLNPIQLVILCAVFGALLSVTIQVFVFGPIMKRATNHHAGEMSILIGGIGVAAIPLAIALHVTGGLPFSFTSTYNPSIYSVGDVTITNTAIGIVVVSMSCILVMSVWLRRSKSGLGLRSIAVDPEVASLMGVNERKLAIGSMAVAGVLAGLAGGLLTLYLTNLTPNSGDSYLLKAFAIIVLGGLGSMLGLAVGGVILATVETVVILNDWSSWSNAVAFGIILVVLLLRPQGILGKRVVQRT